jgi:hypothetical protein
LVLFEYLELQSSLNCPAIQGDLLERHTDTNTMAPSVADLPSALTTITPKKSITPTQAGNGKDEQPHVHGMQDRRPLEAISHGDVVLAGIPKYVSFEAQREDLKQHLAAAFRHWAREGFVLGISGHVSTTFSLLGSPEGGYGQGMERD